MDGFVNGALAACAAVTATNPMEVLKVRLQLQGELVSGTKIYRNPLSSMRLIYRNEGLKGLQKGLFPAYIYQMLLNGTRLGIYDPFCALLLPICPSQTVTRILAGGMAGVIGAFVSSPMFLVKTRMQSFTDGSPSVGYQHANVKRGVIHVLSSIYTAEGLRGLWRGSDATMLRTGVGSAVQLSLYDTFKGLLLSTSYFDEDTHGHGGIGAHFSASLITSLFVCLFMNPFDVASVRMTNQPTSSDGKIGLLYRNVGDCLKKTIIAEGPSALYKGAFAHYLRIGCLKLT